MEAHILSNMLYLRKIKGNPNVVAIQLLYPLPDKKDTENNNYINQHKTERKKTVSGIRQIKWMKHSADRIEYPYEAALD